ncbi:GNAT family N-acetyltransferase [Desulfopila inferna]|uniref:GNAT family N-acetyltransferase n=1 Tax=Desulfopila inferna TaxID=468528 RepID=UPI0019663A94|nr:GNAT family N-acetyltransferase [Desulfopila inferna]MBM9605712.1 GNAT family N-acetyltransferase [Desulfopila inferna]
MRIRHITAIKEIPFGKDQWNELVSLSETNTVFQTHEWFMSWWLTFGSDNTLFLLILYDRERVAGIAPMMLSRKWKTRELRFVSDINADYCDFIVSSSEKEAMLSAVFDYLQKNNNLWDSIYLMNIPETSSTASLLRSIFLHHRLHAVASQVDCPVLKFGKDSADSRLKPSRTLKRHLNYFKKNGDLRFIIFKSLPIAEKSLDIFYTQHKRRWKNAGKPSLFNDGRYTLFYNELVRRAWPSGWLFFSCLQFNGQPISFHFGFDYSNKVIWYKPTFDIGFRNRSPGRILLQYLIQYCQDHNKLELDFTVGNEPFKEEYATDVRKNVNFWITRSKLMHNLVVIFLKAKQLKRRLANR